jgi:hypothetical protein
VAYSPDGRHLVTANGNGTAYVIRIPPSPVTATDLTGSDWFDLLQFQADACEMRPGDSWVKQDGTWTTAGVPKAVGHLAFPVVARGSYELKAEVSRREGTDCLFFSLPVGPGSVILVFNGGGKESKAGLSCVRGITYVDERNPTHVRHEPFGIGKKINISVSVRISGDQAEITAKADGVPPIHWAGPLSDLTPQEDVSYLPGRIGVGYVSRYTIHSMQLKRVDGVARVHLPRRPTPAGTQPRPAQ